MPTVCYRLERPIPGGLGIVDGWVVSAAVERLPLAGGGPAPTGPGGRILPVGELPLPGRHNLANLLAAVGVALLFGVAPDAIRRQAASFRGVEHRLELVAEVDGVRFVNDSQGTQPDAVAAALRSFEAPLVLIAGGRDKGVDLSRARPGRRGAGGGRSADRGERARPRRPVPGRRRGPRRGGGHARRRAAARGRDRPRAARGAPAGTVATVLLSPAAASFDQFPDYAARGRAFKAGVAALAAARAEPARR